MPGKRKTWKKGMNFLPKNVWENMKMSIGSTRRWTMEIESILETNKQFERK